MPKPTKKEIYIDESIDSWVLQDFTNQIRDLQSGDELEIHINSGGGGVFEGIAMYNRILSLREKGIQVKTCIDGIAASIASIVAIAGSPVCIGQNATFMIHNPWAMTIGDADAHTQQAQILTQIQAQLIDTYKQKGIHTEEQLKDLLKNETYLTASCAKEMGFVDEIFNQTVEISPKNFKNLIPNQLQHQYSLVINNKNMDKPTQEPAKPQASTDGSNLELTETKKQIQNLETQLLQLRAEGLVNAAILQGKIDPDAKDEAINIAKADPKCFEAFISKIKTPETQAPSIFDLVIAANQMQAQAQAAPNDRKNWDIRRWEKEDPEGLKKMFETNKPLYDKLEKQTYAN